jgi:hypothetical protein
LEDVGGIDEGHFTVVEETRIAADAASREIGVNPRFFRVVA